MAHLQDLFSKSDVQFSSTNASLRYEDKSFETIANDRESENVTYNGPIVASVIILYRYQNSNPIDLGKKGAAIIANKDNENKSYCVICYEIKDRKLLFSITIHKDFIVNVLTKNFISFYDSKCNYFAMRFPNNSLLEQFVTAIAMSRAPRIVPFNYSKNIIVQNLNSVQQNENENIVNSESIMTVYLQIWLCDIKHHPFKKGDSVFNAQKSIKLNSNKILPAISIALKKPSLNSKKIIISSSHYAFGQKGNKTLDISPNAPLIIEVTVQTIDDIHDIEESSTKQRMAKLSAATGGTLLATLIGDKSDNINNNEIEGRTPPPLTTLTPLMALHPINTKLNTISLQLSNLSNRLSASWMKISSKDIIKCLNELNNDLEENKTEINAQKLEINTLKSELNNLKTRNHELLEKNNHLMEKQYDSMNAMNTTHQESLAFRTENIENKKQINILQKQNEDMTQRMNQRNQEILRLKLIINDLENVNEENKQLKQEITTVHEQCKSTEKQLFDSKNESKQILNQSKKRIEKIKNKFEIHQIDLIKRVLEFVYIKYNENIKTNEDTFNHISFFRTITKQILENPNYFDEDDDEESANAEEV